MNSKQDLDLSSLSTASAMFQGYNNVTAQALNTAIEGSITKNSGVSELQYKVTKSLQEIYQSLNISSSISAGYAGFSGEAKVNLVNQLNLTKESLCIVIKASDKQDIYRTNNVSIKSGIKLPTTEKEVNDFVRAYGDSYISELATGAEYYAVYAFICETKEQRFALETQFSASGISLSGGSLSLDFKSQIEKVSKSSSSTVTFQQIVSGLKNPNLPDQNNIIKYALDFFDKEIDNPAIISYTSTSYDHVPNFPADVLNQVRKNVNYFTDPTGNFTKKGIDVDNLKNQCENLNLIYNFYKFNGDKKLLDVLELVKLDLTKLKIQQSDYSFNPNQVFILPELPSLNEGKPVLQFRFINSDLHGGSGGAVFNDVNQTSYFQKRTRLVNLKLRSGTYVDRIASTFENSDPTNSIYVLEHGGNGGNQSFDLQLTPGISLKSITGRSGAKVDQLSFEATNGQKISGGGNGGNPFSFLIPEGYFVAGFRGQSGSLIDLIGAVYAKLLPANWDK
ncbi:jacalin-like lectin [Acinetobacter sp. ESBL14]|uniref:jacalin-like lectin n=1 Tax=Acinetobacter sp. ESBL14 TaxID=3077329 RepID=UPI002FCB6D67